MANGGRLKWNDTELVNKLRSGPQRADRALIAIMGLHAPKAQAAMRSNAPWKDRTSNARNGLFAAPFNMGPVYGIVLAHRVNYGIWLEVRWSGRYAIINPTVQREAPQVMATCSLLFARMFGS